MKIDELIKAQKQNLDVESPPPELWEHIRKDWKMDKTNTYSGWWRVAAIFFVISSLVLLTYAILLQNKVDRLASLGDISTHYQSVEQGYQSEIQKLEATLSMEEISQYEDLSWLVEEMETLEAVNRMYRSDIGQAADETQLVGALIDYYEKKIKLLKKLELELTRAKKLNQNEKDTDNRIAI